MTVIRVLHPITRLIVGGAQENTMFTAALLDKSKYQTEVLSGPQTGSEGSLIEEVRERGVTLTILPELVRQVNPVLDLVALWKLYRYMRLARFTIVHTHSSKAGILGRIAARIAGVPVIIHTVHGWSFHDRMTKTTHLAYILLERLTALFSQALICVAQQDIEKGLREKIGHRAQYHLIRSAIPLEEFDPTHLDPTSIRHELGIPLDVPVLGNVGRFSEQKNPLEWVSIAAKVGQVLHNCYFLLVGDGPLRLEVENILKQEGLMDRCVLTGLRRDVSRLISTMDVFLLTSLWEGLPRVIPQSLAMQVPVVAYRVDGTIEAIEEGVTGFLCNPGDINEMASSCVKLLSDPDLRGEMGRRGREFAMREFDVREMVNQIANLYIDLLKSR